MKPAALVFESEYEGARVFSTGMYDDRWSVWARAATALPPGDDS